MLCEGFLFCREGGDGKLSKLTLKQKRFADEYIISGNIEQSAISAGYSKNYARAQAHKLLANVGIKNYIDERLKILDSEKIADQKEILEFLTSAMRGEVTEPILRNSGDFEQVIVDVKPNVATRKAAAELLGKRYKMWTDKVEMDVNSDITIKVGEWDDD